MKKSFDGFLFLCCIGAFVEGVAPFLRIGGSISTVQIAIQQSFWELKVVGGLITGLLVGGLWGRLYNKKLYQCIYFGIASVALVVGYISNEGYRQTWGWKFAREMLPFSTSWLWAYFAGALLIHLLFKRVKKNHSE